MGVFATAKSPSDNLLKSIASDKLQLNMNTKDASSDEREEGEIIDEYEDIISSDEEFSMRQRIEELEAKNAELEKIENISGVYGNGNYDYIKIDASNHQIDRYPLISIDISDEEGYPPAPQMTRISKRRKSLTHSCSRRKLLQTSSSSSSYRRRKQSSSPPPAPQYRASDKLLLSMFHNRVATHVSYSSKRKRKSKKSHSTKTSRKTRDYYASESDSDIYDNYNLDVHDSYENFNSSDAEKSYSLNRDELRVALARNPHRIEQHVSLKDRLIRRKENTNTLNEKNTQDTEEIVEEESKPDSSHEKSETEDNVEEQELRIIALKSAVIRKHLVRKKRNENVAYSPSDFDGIYANATLSPSINNIDDAEPCMEISPVPSPKMILSDDEGMDTKPVDMDIVNSDSDCDLPSYEQWVPIEQIPLPNTIGMLDEVYAPTPLRYNDGEQKAMPTEVRFESPTVSPVNLDSEVEEEELALRALLLAKMNSPKVNKVVKKERPRVDDLYTADRDTSMEAEALRHFLINNMKKKAQSKNSSASVLKEAVRRLTARNTSRSPADSLAENASGKAKPESVSQTAEQINVNLGQSIADMANLQIDVQRQPEQIVKSEELLHNVVDDVVHGENAETKSMEKLDTNEEKNTEAEEPSQHDIEPKEFTEGEILGHREVHAEEVESKKNIFNESPEGAPMHEVSTEGRDLFPSLINNTLGATELQEDEAASDRVVGKAIVLAPECVIVKTEKTEESNLNEEQKQNSNQAVAKNEQTVQKEKNYEESSSVAVAEENVQNINLSLVELSTLPPLKKDETKVREEQTTDGKEKLLDKKSVAEKVKDSIPIVQEVISTSVIEQQVLPEKIVKSTVKSITDNKSNLKNSSQVKVIPKPRTDLTPSKTLSVNEVKEKPDRALSKKPHNNYVLKKSIPSAGISPIPVAKTSAQPLTTLRTKIVKPNKVINQQSTDLKRKSSDFVTKAAIPPKKTKLEDSTNRLITAAEVPQVKKLIIQLRASDSESEYSAMSADDYDYDGREDARVGSFINRNITIGNEYYDIASPISLPMESPYDTPSRVASPIASVTPTPEPSVEKSIVNDFFEAKLDQFLKNVRSKVADSTKTPMEHDVSAPINTPVAVRHLPEASQHEYRRLINRMKLLERQKQAKNLQVIVKTEDSTVAANAGRVMTETDSKTLVRKVLVKNASVNNAKPTSNKKTADVKPSLKVVAQNTKTLDKLSKPVPIASTAKKPATSPQKSSLLPQKSSVPQPKSSKENMLHLYENSYRKTGSSIISNLDKSIELVMLSKKAKMAKFKYEHRLREIQKEMDEVQRNMEQQQERITKIYPEICGSHRMVESLTARRVKINKTVNALGKSVIGPEYSVNDDQKSIISEKLKKLAAEIKFVNSMKLSDVEKWERMDGGSLSDKTAVVTPSKDLNGSTLEPSPAIKKEPHVPPPSVQKVPLDDSENSPTTIALDVSVPEATQKMESKLNDTIVPETELNEEKQKNPTNGQEEAVITMPLYDKEALDPQKMGEPHKEEKLQVGGAKLQDYVSPLSHLRDERQINPNGIVCPYQLMGQCDDKDCKYMHLDNYDDSSNILEEVDQQNKETA